MPTYLRFVIAARDRDSGKRQGLFQATAALAGSGALSPVEVVEYEAVRLWFADNLVRPERLAVSRRPHAKAQALSWFKSGSGGHIDQMRRFQALLEAHGVAVTILRTDRPGYVVFEDELQVAAYPFADTPS